MVPLKKINLIVRKADLKKAININYLSGAANRIRTCDPVITNDVLYQLSYCGGPYGAFGDGAENART